MCPPKLLTEMQDQTISRRNFFKFGLGTTAAAAAAMTACQTEAAPLTPTAFSNVMDLTHVLGPGTPTWPGTPPFQVQPFVNHEADGFYGNTISYWEHIGTHMDAPVHFGPQAIFVDQIPAASLIVPAVVLDISERAAKEPDAVVTPDDILAWEQRYGRVPNNAAILMHSGWSLRFGSEAQHRNEDSSGVMHFPGFGKEAIDFLLAERNIAGIGVDTMSLDFGASATFDVHYTILPTNRWGLENLANLTDIPPSGATLFVGAPKVASGSGGPSRVLAVW